MVIRFLDELVDYAYSDVKIGVREFLIEQAANTVDNNKGYMWEQALKKAMEAHTILLGGNTVGMDFTDTTDAKIGTFYLRTDGVWEASIGNIRTKVGPLRVCLVVPAPKGGKVHRVYFLFIPHAAYQKYAKGSKALKFTLNANTNMISGKLTEYICSFDEVTKPYIPAVALP